MDYLAKDIVGISAYDFYHAGDVALIQGHHAKCMLNYSILMPRIPWDLKIRGFITNVRAGQQAN